MINRAMEKSNRNDSTGHRGKYDAVVAGAGPAGSMLGYWLAEKGVRVAIVEKKRLPRYKACGGGVTRRAMDLLPFSLDHVIEDRVFKARLSYENRPLFVETFDRPVIAMTMREKLDHFLVQKAVSAGAQLCDGTAVLSVSGQCGDLTVRTSGGNLRTSVVAACDGAFSRTARSLGLRVRGSFMTAVEGELHYAKPWNHNLYCGTAHFDFGVVPRGYGWVFPKKDHLSVGIVTLDGRFSGWKTWFHNYLKLKNATGFSHIRPLRGRRIPYSPRPGNVVANDKGLATGDAAGLSDPITGEGIYYAFKSARLAAQTIAEALHEGFHAMERYEARLKESIGRDLFWAGCMSRVLFSHPFSTRTLLKYFGKTMAENELGVIFDRQSYTDIKNRFFNPLRLMEKLLE